LKNLCALAEYAKCGQNSTKIKKYHPIFSQEKIVKNVMRNIFISTRGAMEEKVDIIEQFEWMHKDKC